MLSLEIMFKYIISTLFPKFQRKKKGTDLLEVANKVNE